MQELIVNEKQGLLILEKYKVWDKSWQSIRWLVVAFAVVITVAPIGDHRRSCLAGDL